MEEAKLFFYAANMAWRDQANLRALGAKESYVHEGYFYINETDRPKFKKIKLLTEAGLKERLKQLLIKTKKQEARHGQK